MSHPTYVKDSSAVETYRGVVDPWKCDQTGHMNVQFYVATL
ncbi:MAG: hypothetical protein OEY55_11105 [Acidimicrobiia bacterium]|nr:hypothetical protein [Acidimicrobiia bacterium]